MEGRGVTDPVLILAAPLPVAPANKGRAVTATLSAPLCLDPKGGRDGDRAGEIVEWVKALAAKADRLSSIPGPTPWRGKSTLLLVRLSDLRLYTATAQACATRPGLKS